MRSCPVLSRYRKKMSAVHAARIVVKADPETDHHGGWDGNARPGVARSGTEVTLLPHQRERKRARKKSEQNDACGWDLELYIPPAFEPFRTTGRRPSVKNPGCQRPGPGRITYGDEDDRRPSRSSHYGAGSVFPATVSFKPFAVTQKRETNAAPPGGGSGKRRGFSPAGIQKKILTSAALCAWPKLDLGRDRRPSGACLASVCLFECVRMRGGPLLNFVSSFSTHPTFAM